MVARFTGDRMNARLGPVRLVRAGMAVVAIAYGIVLLAASPALVLPGVLVVGVGVSNAIPLSFAAAGRIPPGGPSLAAVFTLCYAGFLGGPPVVGLIADSFLKLHAKGLCYQDINFGNIFLDPVLGDICICDNDNVDINGERGGVFGTKKFMAPEIVRCEKRPDANTDLYSLAVVLFEMLGQAGGPEFKAISALVR